MASAVIASVVAFALFGCSFASADEPAPLFWGADADGGAPYVFRDPERPAEVIGFEVDLAAALAAELKRPLTFKQYDYVSLLQGLTRRDFDMAINGLEVTPQRKEHFRLSRPYYIYKLQLVTRKGDHRFKNLDDCKAAGAVVGTLGETAAERLLIKQDIALKRYEDQIAPYTDLAVGSTDAVLMDLPIAAYYARPNPKLQYAGVPFAEGAYVIAWRKDQEELAKQVDAALMALAKRGELRRIYEKWQIFNDDQLRLAQDDPNQPARGVSRPATMPSSASTTDQKQSQPPVGAAGSASAPASGSTPPSISNLPPPGAGQRIRFSKYLPQLLKAACVTVYISVASMALAMVLGLLIATTRMYAPAPLRWLAVTYIEFFRGVPMLPVLYFLYLGLPEIAQDYHLPVSLALWGEVVAILGFGMNYAAYEAEIYRAGIGSIPQGQWEAAASLGMSPLATFRRIILPQAVRTILPPMTNDFVSLFKDTSLVSVIAVNELTKEYLTLSKNSLQYLELGIVTAALYLIMSVPLGYLSIKLERRWSKGQK